MDFYFDIGLAVILRIIKDRRNRGKYYEALAKLFVKLRDLTVLDPEFDRQVKAKEAE
jgi:hypothetical protein